MRNSEGKGSGLLAGLRHLMIFLLQRYDMRLS